MNRACDPLKPIVFLIFLLNFQSVSYGQSTEIWGVTQSGGSDYGGTIFKTNSEGDLHQVIHNFIRLDGEVPRSIVEYSENMVLGVTYRGGESEDLGVIYTYDVIEDSYEVKYEFSNSDSVGYYPYGNLTVAENGKIYGMTGEGGPGYNGSIYEFNPVTDEVKPVHILTHNIGDLSLMSDSWLYGVASGNQGDNGNGIIFRVNPSTYEFEEVYSFPEDGSVLGTHPGGALLEVNSGELFGLCWGGGENEEGVIFCFNMESETYEKKADLSYDITGVEPKGGLVLGNDEMLYGTCEDGGIDQNAGVLFKFDPQVDSVETVQYFGGEELGRDPERLFKMNDGTFVVALSNGDSYEGDFYHYDPVTGELVLLASYYRATAAQEIIQLQNGDFYGVASILDFGDLFKYSFESDTFNVVLNFNTNHYGAKPYGSLIQSTADQKLYGLTFRGGLHGDGVAFRIDPETEVYEKLYDLDRDIEGNYPEGGLIETSSGVFLGMCSEGGENSTGTIIRYNSIADSLEVLYGFNCSTGCRPYGDLLKVDSTLHYGVTKTGGNENSGVLYSFDSDELEYTVLIHFGDYLGNLPSPYLLHANNGLIYGTVQEGGENDSGFLFQYNPSSDEFEVLFQFDMQETGKTPIGGLTQAPNGLIYGTTSEGNYASDGAIFSYNIELNEFEQLFEFNEVSGHWPVSDLLIAQNGKMYGLLGGNAWGNDGALYEYDINTNTVELKKEFTGFNGAYPRFTNLIEIETCPSTSAMTQDTACSSYTSPSGNYIWTSSGTYFDTIPNSNGCDSLLTIHLTLRDTLFVNDQFSDGDIFTTSVGESENDGYHDEPYNSIQQAIDNACPNGVIKIDAGTYNEQVVVNSDSLTLIGAGTDKTYLDLSGIEGAGVNLNGNGLTLKNLTIIGDSLSNQPFSALKIGSESSIISGVSVQNVRVESSAGNGLEIIRAQNTSLVDVEAFDNAGSGISIINAGGAVIENVSTSGNNITGVSITNRDDLDGMTHDVVIEGDNSIAESDLENGGLLLEMTANKPISWGIASNDVRDVIFSSGDFGYALAGSDIPQNEENEFSYLRFYQSLEQAEQAGVGDPIFLNPYDRYIFDALDSDGSPQAEYYVFDDPESKMSIQAAINASMDGNTINVFEGNFYEQIMVSKNIQIQGQGETRPVISAFEEMTSSVQGDYTPIVFINDCDSVSISNIELDGAQTGDTNQDLVGVLLFNSSGLFDNLNVHNIQPDQNSSDFDGAGFFCISLDANTNEIVLQNSQFQQCQNSPFVAFGAFASVIVQNNLIEGYGASGLEREKAIEIHSAENVIIENNSIINFEYSSGLENSHAVYANNISSIVCQRNIFEQCDIGIYSKASLMELNDNEILDLKTGLVLDDFMGQLFLNCSGNIFTQVETVLVSSTGDVSINLEIVENSFSEYSQLLSSGLSNEDLMMSCNWFGTMDANEIEANLGGPYSYEPFLTSGTDEELAIGFQPSPNSCDGTTGGCTDPEADNYDPNASVNNGTCEYCSADLNDDGFIKTDDLLLLLTDFGCNTGICDYDIDFDGVINSSDLLILLGQFGSQCGSE